MIRNIFLRIAYPFVYFYTFWFRSDEASSYLIYGGFEGWVKDGGRSAYENRPYRNHCCYDCQGFDTDDHSECPNDYNFDHDSWIAEDEREAEYPTEPPYDASYEPSWKYGSSEAERAWRDVRESAKDQFLGEPLAWHDGWTLWAGPKALEIGGVR